MVNCFRTGIWLVERDCKMRETVGKGRVGMWGSRVSMLS